MPCVPSGVVQVTVNSALAAFTAPLQSGLKGWTVGWTVGETEPAQGKTGRVKYSCSSAGIPSRTVNVAVTLEPWVPTRLTSIVLFPSISVEREISSGNVAARDNGGLNVVHMQMFLFLYLSPCQHHWQNRLHLQLAEFHPKQHRRWCIMFYQHWSLHYIAAGKLKNIYMREYAVLPVIIGSSFLCLWVNGNECIKVFIRISCLLTVLCFSVDRDTEAVQTWLSNSYVKSV